MHLDAVCGAAAASPWALLLIACSGYGSGYSYGYGNPQPSPTPVGNTWTDVYASVISQRCAPCHTTAGGIGVSSGHLDMTSQAAAYANLVNVAAAGSACAGKGVRVMPGAASSSVLYLKVAAPVPCGGQMPLGGAPLPQSDVAAIGGWINAGAGNN
jgi:hypothetical protein